MSRKFTVTIITVASITGILLLVPPSYAQDGLSQLELLVSELVSQVSALRISQSDTQKTVQNNTARIAALEKAVDLLTSSDQSPPTWTVTPPDSHEYEIKHVGKSWGICIDATDPDGLPIAYGVITKNSKILTTSKCASGHEHRFTIPDAGQSETHTIRATALGGNPANEHVDFTWTASAAAAKDYMPNISIVYPSQNTLFYSNGSVYSQSQGNVAPLTILAARHDGTMIPLEDLTVTQSRASAFYNSPTTEIIPNGTASPYLLPHMGWLWAIPDMPGQLTLTVSYTDYINGQNHTAADSVVIHVKDMISVDDLPLDTSSDSDWHYTINGHYASLAATKRLGSLALGSSDVGSGTIYLFKTFDTSEIKNHNITINADTSSPHNVMVYVVDGKYTQSDFVAGPPLKGGGILASYALPDLPESFEPDWTRAQYNQTTLIISLEKKIAGSPFRIDSIEFKGHIKWIFDDYKVEQRGLEGTYLLLPTRGDTYHIPFNDTFTNSLDGWTYWGYTTNYTLRHDNKIDIQSVFISMDAFDVFAGMGKIVDTSNVTDNQDLLLSYDYRASSLTPNSAVTNSILYVFDADTQEELFSAMPVSGGTTDTGWKHMQHNLTDAISDSDKIEIVLGFHDSWIASWDQKNWYDNISVYAKVR